MISITSAAARSCKDRGVLRSLPLFNPTLVRAQALDRPPSVLVFDVAESMLDLQVLRPQFQRVFGDGAMVDEWSGETILYSESATLTNTFAPFGQLGAGVLRMLGRIHNVSISEADVAELGKGLASLPPHPDVPDSLRKLKASGYRLVTLTDSPVTPSRGITVTVHSISLAIVFMDRCEAACAAMKESIGRMLRTGSNRIRRSTLSKHGFFIAAQLLFIITNAHAASNDGPGVTDTEIRLGQTMPYTGPASSLGVTGKAMEAYFSSVNENGGINGRKIKLISLDDGLSPAKTVEQTRRLVEQDEVLAIVGSLGSTPNTAIQKFLNSKKIPQLFIMSGSARFLNPKEFPWTMPWPVSSARVGEAYGRFIRETKPNAKIAIIYQDDEYGRKVQRGIRKGLGPDVDKLIVAEKTYDVTDPTIDSQIVSLKSSGADVLFHASIPKFAAQGLRKVHELDWHPIQFIDVPAASISATFKPIGLDKALGVLSATYLKDPLDPTWQNDEAVKRYLAVLKKFGPELDPSDSNAIFGYSVGESIVAVLKQCGDDLTRENVMKRAANLRSVDLSLLLPGITLNAAEDDYALIKQLQLMKFNGTRWERFGQTMRIP
jgi:branched-chain amino acid transport system substrate-binding protein